MSTILNTNGAALTVPKIYGKGNPFQIVTAEWNSEITHSLRDAAVETLVEGGVERDRIILHSVPGTVELINAAANIIKFQMSDGVIIIGCVIRGDTPHFDYVCQIAAQGTALLNSQGNAAVTFGVLTVDNLEQAQQRAGGILGNKGAEAACAAIEMANLRHRILKRNPK